MLPRLFHITHVDNLPGIASRGLLCRKQILARGIPYIDLSDPNCQARRSERLVEGSAVDLHHYVPLFVNPRNSMLWRLWRSLQQQDQHDKLAILELCGDAANWSSSLLADGIASSSLTRLFRSKDPSGRAALDWSAIQAARWPALSPQDRRQRMAEVLVSRSLSPRHIRKVWLQKPSALEHLQARMGRADLACCVVDAQGELFYRD